MNLWVDTSITYNRGYTLEAQIYTENKWKTNPAIQKFNHLGYMQALFRSRRQACAYYDFWNPHMRPLNEHGTYCSARDPETNIRYVVRKFYRETQTIPPFDLRDKPKFATSTKRGRIVAITTLYPTYKYLEEKPKHKSANSSSTVKLPKIK